MGIPKVTSEPTPRPLAAMTDKMLAQRAMQAQDALNEFLHEMSFRKMSLTCQYVTQGAFACAVWDKPVYTPLEVARGVYDVVLTARDAQHI
jgi:hypothetical protein